MKSVITVILALFLTGCVEYRWVKEGASAQDENVAETACKAQALKTLPPDNMVSARYTSKDKKHQTTDTSYSTTDANQSNRNILVKDCMYHRGWSQVEIKH
ncbi:hypothetical protein [Erwinia sp. 198]|uniref:hypothetical protein n=1 Tax=Erwinia sp. 198 TaxID=2022746 RepID=UPI000F686DD1|nr:hypothetical protein [Erwinia sp. 198]RRZ95673.1 hypothetical protein EGK14_03715 [Erwinia sp. 198]